MSAAGVAVPAVLPTVPLLNSVLETRRQRVRRDPAFR
jgi:hypothetical protein